AAAARARAPASARLRPRRRHGGAPTRAGTMTAPQRSRAVLESFNFAFEGVVHVLRTERNLRLHFLIAAGVMIAAVAFDVTRFELIALLLSISFVLIAEMLNSAIEAAVDLATDSLHPLAKLAKDVAA